MTNRENNNASYIEFCKTNPQIPIFFQPWWLDAVCEKGQWEVCLAKDGGGNIQGVLPFYQSRYFGWNVIMMPPLTPYLGVWIKDTVPIAIGRKKKEDFKRKVMQKLIAQLPGFAYYAQRHPVNLVNWLPFYHNGFHQTTYYTFMIPKENSKKQIWKSMDAPVRNKIRKAEKAGIVVQATEDIELFYKVNQKSYDRQSLKMPYSIDFIKKLDAVLKLHQSRQLLIAQDADHQIHAALYLVWDNDTIYNLMLGADTQLRKSGAIQMLLWHGIQKAISENKNFDFEGGMMPNIAPVFRAFGATLIPLHKIYKGGNRIFRLVTAFKNK